MSRVPTWLTFCFQKYLLSACQYLLILQSFKEGSNFAYSFMCSKCWSKVSWMIFSPTLWTHKGICKVDLLSSEAISASSTGVATATGATAFSVELWDSSSFALWTRFFILAIWWKWLWLYRLVFPDAENSSLVLLREFHNPVLVLHQEGSSNWGSVH